MSEIRARHVDGTTETLPLAKAEIDYSLDKATLARVWTSRPEVNEANLDVADDEILVYKGGKVRFAGVLKDIERRGTDTVLVVDSYERYARDAEPAPAGEQYTSTTDDTVVKDAIDATSQLKRGNITQQKSGFDFSFNYASQALKIRLMRKLTRSEVRYNFDKTVDYQDAIGTDRSASVTISPSNQNVTKFRITKTSGEQVATHLRVIGNGADADVTATNFDPQNDRERWRRAYFKSVSDYSNLKDLGDRLLDVISKQWKEIKATITGVDVNLGDTLHVTYTDENIDGDYRVVELTEKINPKGVHYEATLSNRDFGRDNPSEKTQRQVSELARRESSGGVSGKTPTVNIPVTEIPANNGVGQRLVVPDGSVLSLWTVGADEKTGGLSSTSIELQLRKNISGNDVDGTLVYAKSTTFTQGENQPLAQVEASGSDVNVEFRIYNGSSSYIYISGFFGYELD